MSSLTTEVNSTPSEQVVNNTEVVPEATTVNTHGGDGSSGPISVEMSTDSPAPVEEPTNELPDKFQGKSQEDIIKMYQELEKKLGSQSNTADDAGNNTEGAENTNTPEAQADKVVEGNPEVKTWQDKWKEQGGSLTEEQWVEVQKLTGQEMEDLRSWESWVKEQNKTNEQKAVDDAQAIVNQTNNTIYETLGGEANYNKMAEWANANMSSAEMDAIEAMLSTPELAERGARLLQTNYTMANGQEPSVTPVNSPSANLQGTAMFNSDAEWLEAVADPRYDSSTAYRNEVDKKLEASMNAGTIRL